MIKDIQAVLQACGKYSGAIDGIAGPKTQAAIAAVNGMRIYRDAGIAAMQRCLNDMFFDAGEVDGIAGPQTRAALSLFYSSAAVIKKPISVPAAPTKSYTAASYADMTRVFGQPGSADCTAGTVQLPFSFKIAWDLSKTIASFKCHKILAKPLTDIFAQAAELYGEAEYRRLRLDRFGGCYNFRSMRGASKLSIHSWGAAVDLDPERNQLSWTHTKAAFAQPQYKPFWEIVNANGAWPGGWLWDKDWMHFQFCK